MRRISEKVPNHVICYISLHRLLLIAYSRQAYNTLGLDLDRYYTFANETSQSNALTKGLR